LRTEPHRDDAAVAPWTIQSRLADIPLVAATPAMEALFWLKQAVKVLVLPPNGPLLLALLGLLVARRHPVAGRQMTWTGVVGLLVLSMPIVSAWIIGARATPPPLDLTKRLRMRRRS
jgi:hypothetical protein